MAANVFAYSGKNEAPYPDANLQVDPDIASDCHF